MYLSNITIYPVKSTAGQDVSHALVEPRGLADDRRWLVVGRDNQGLTGRTHPRLLGIRATVEQESLLLEAAGMPSLEVPSPRVQGAGFKVGIWRDTVNACSVSEDADDWLCRVLKDQVRLVYMPADSVRPVDPSRSRDGDMVSFADGFPLLLIGEASLHALNQRLHSPVTMARFRTNLSVAGCAAHAEDGWKRLRIGAVEFDVAGACDRCVMTTIDPVRLLPDADREPLRTLAGYRRDPGRGVPFGVNLIPRGTGMLSRGEAIEIQH